MLSVQRILNLRCFSTATATENDVTRLLKMVVSAMAIGKKCEVL